MSSTGGHTTGACRALYTWFDRRQIGGQFGFLRPGLDGASGWAWLAFQPQQWPHREPCGTAAGHSGILVASRGYCHKQPGSQELSIKPVDLGRTQAGRHLTWASFLPLPQSLGTAEKEKGEQSISAGVPAHPQQWCSYVCMCPHEISFED